MRTGKRGAFRAVDARMSRILAWSGAGAVAIMVMLGANRAEAAQHPRYHAHPRHASLGFRPALVAESIVLDADLALDSASRETMNAPSSRLDSSPRLPLLRLTSRMPPRSITAGRSREDRL